MTSPAARLDYDESSIEPRELARLVDPAYWADQGPPHGLCERLRGERPVAWVEPPRTAPFWAVLRHADVRHVCSAPDLFSNAGRISVSFSDPAAERLSPEIMLNQDPPEHTRSRQLLSRQFTPRAIDAQRVRIEPIVREALDAFAGDGRERDADFVAEVTRRVPTAVISEWLGVPTRDRTRIHDLVSEISRGQDPEIARGRSAGQILREAMGEICAYFGDLIAERRARPREDLISHLANSERAAGIDLPQYIMFLFAAGSETTQYALGSMMHLLLQNPETLARLRASPELVPGAVEEALRMAPPVGLMARTATRDTPLGGQRIAAGDSVVLFFLSANRDEEIFTDPHTFRLDREPNPHLTFSVGRHVCMGAHLARLELRSALRELADRIETIELAGEPRYALAPAQFGPTRLPLRFRMRPALSEARSGRGSPTAAAFR